jgi:8-oxo-dGTP pyrophosphatase MutT (NUDIX family)
MGKNTQSQKTGSSDVLEPPMLREFASGGVIFRKFGNEIKWLVAKNNPSEKVPQEYWRLPKGWIDDRDGGDNPGPISSGEVKAKEEELVGAALREVREEGGVEAKIVKKIGTVKYFSNSSRGKVLKFVTFYLMEFVRDLPEGFGFETSEVNWLSFNEAFNRISRDHEKQILVKAKELLAQEN